MTQLFEICTYCSMSKQYGKGVQKWKRVTWWWWKVKSLEPYVFIYMAVAEEISLKFKELGKEIENRFIVMWNPEGTKYVSSFSYWENYLLSPYTSYSLIIEGGMKTIYHHEENKMVSESPEAILKPMGNWRKLDIWFDLVDFYDISTIVGYLMPNPLYTYILNIYDLVGLGFTAYQPL